MISLRSCTRPGRRSDVLPASRCRVSSRSRLSAHGMIARRHRALVCLSYGSRRRAAIAHTRRSLCVRCWTARHRQRAR